MKKHRCAMRPVPHLDCCEDDWITPKAAADMLGYSVRGVRKLLRQGRLIGRQLAPCGWWEVSLTSVEDMLARIQARETIQP